MGRDLSGKKGREEGRNEVFKGGRGSFSKGGEVERSFSKEGGSKDFKRR